VNPPLLEHQHFVSSMRRLIGTSDVSWEKAAANAVEQASKTLRDLRVAEIIELDMQLDGKGKVEAYRAKVSLSFKVER
jgi:flavin-binding protein dodecin